VAKKSKAMTAVSVGILSDTHGHLDSRVQSVVNGCDYVIHAGDICGADILEKLKPRITLHAVAGNNDYPAAWDALEAEIVKALPRQIKLQLPGGLLIVEHGHRLGNHPDHEQFRWDHAEAKLVVYGHTHKRVVDQSAEPWIANPGAAGVTRTKGGPSCLILHASEKDWNIVEKVFPDQQAA
jgi:putative phosphoesterase